MKVEFSEQNNNQIKKIPQMINFGAGLTPKMMQEINKTDVIAISNKLAQKGIPNDFKSNKVLAWCCDKTIDVFEQLNQRFRLNLALPQGIYVEDFRKLNVEDSQMYGFCNLAPFELRKGFSEDVPSRVLFFNSLQKWEDIDSISDRRYREKLASTDFFLDIPFHEFVHSAQEDRLLDLYDGKMLLEKLQSLKDPKQIAIYQKKYGAKMSRISNYALNNPLDAIACDLSRRISNSISRTTLTPTKNPFKGLPYQDNLSLLQQLRLKQNSLNQILRSFWNGVFD